MTQYFQIYSEGKKSPAAKGGGKAQPRSASVGLTRIPSPSKIRSVIQTFKHLLSFLLVYQVVWKKPPLPDGQSPLFGTDSIWIINPNYERCRLLLGRPCVSCAQLPQRGRFSTSFSLRWKGPLTKSKLAFWEKT